MHIDKYLDLKALKTLKEYLEKEVSSKVQSVTIENRELTIVSTPHYLKEVLGFLRDNKKCQFRMLIDICGADYPERKPRFDVVYHLLSLSNNLRLRLKVAVDDGESVASVCDIFPNANWYEREAFDMYGLLFEGHPDLRRILTDYGFEGHPLRKDFPVEGKVEMFYDEEEGRCVYRPTNLKQDFRHFDWDSPWKGMDDPFALAEEDAPNTFSLDEFDAAPEGK